MSRSRSLAVTLVTRIREDESYSNLVVPAALTEAAFDQRDAALVTDLVYGSIRWRSLLDAIVDRGATGGLARIEPVVLDLLRVASYDLLVRGTPAHVVNEWVSVARRIAPRAGGLVNAVLRRVSERSFAEWKALVSEGLTDLDTDARVTSHPVWIVEEYRTLLGIEESRELLDANNVPPIPTLIALPGVATVPTGVERTTMSPFGFRSERGNPASADGVRTGVIRVQDEGSQLAALTFAHAAPITQDERWLDLCAGPGGKTALLAALARPAGEVLEANELHPHRAELVRRAVAPIDSTIRVHVEDGRTFARSHADMFDRVLVDVPCTGLGALRRRPESRWRKSLDDLDDLVPLQRDLLDAALDAVKPGGMVAYVTCSPLTAETTAVIDVVLGARTDVDVLDTPSVLRAVAPYARGFERGTAVQLYPHRHGTDAMFIQLLRRTR